jgi:uncharacterized membrane protein
MAEIPKNTKKLIFGMGIKWHAMASFIMNSLALVCLLLGIIAAAIGGTLGLSADHWLLIAIVLIVFALSAWLLAYHAAKEGYEK